MIGLTLKQLRYFDALARQQHFGRAAEICAITQPALSLQIKELEALVGAPLVERSARQVRLTPLGEDFLVRARSVLVGVDELEELVRAADGPLAGRLRLGIIPTIAPYLLPEIIKALSERFPALDLEVRETMTQSLVTGLVDAKLDVAIVALPILDPVLQEFALFEEDFVLVRPADEATLPVPPPDMLHTMRLLLLEEGHCLRDQALAVCGSTPRNMMEGSALSTLVQMVSAGMGITLVPEMALGVETRSADVAVARFANAAPKRTVGMVWRKSNPLSEQLMELAAIVRGVGQAVRVGPRK